MIFNQPARGQLYRGTPQLFISRGRICLFPPPPKSCLSLHMYVSLPSQSQLSFSISTFSPPPPRKNHSQVCCPCKLMQNYTGKGLHKDLEGGRVSPTWSFSTSSRSIGETVNLLRFTKNSRQTRFAKSAIVVAKPPSTSQYSFNNENNPYDTCSKCCTRSIQEPF